MGKWAKRVNVKYRDGFPFEWQWACTVCGKVYDRQSDAMKCCAEKKPGAHWLNKEEN